VPEPGTVIERGQIRVESGRVTHAGAEVAARHPGEPVHEFPGCVLIPGLVNCHTHLELTALRGAGRGLPFAAWIQLVTREIAAHDREFWMESARQGARECLAGGVTSLADYSTHGVSSAAIAETGMRGVVFQECFFPDPRADLAAMLEGLGRGVRSLEELAGEDVRVGVSCHAAYNAARPALKAVVQEFGDYPRSIHAAESPAEDRYIREGRGEIAEAHRERGIPVEARRMSPVEYLDNAAYWRPGTLAVHLTQASRGDFAILKARGVSAAFCPVSNAALGAGVAGIAAARRAGLTCGFGTDSAISSERLDMFEEMRFALLASRVRNDPLAPSDVFAMATAEGAAAAGIEGAGVLTPGARADAVAVRLPRPPADSTVVDRLVMQASSGDVRAVYVAGRLEVSQIP